MGAEQSIHVHPSEHATFRNTRPDGALHMHDRRTGLHQKRHGMETINPVDKISATLFHRSAIKPGTTMYLFPGPHLSGGGMNTRMDADRSFDGPEVPHSSAYYPPLSHTVNETALHGYCKK